MNTYLKYCPNVFIAVCDEQHKKGDHIEMTTRFRTHEAIVFNEIAQKNGKFYYSVVRADGYNIQERNKAKAERLLKWAESAENKSNEFYEASKEGKDFLVLAEPIKIGHLSEKRHRALIERNHNRMGKSIEMQKKADSYEDRAEYWAKQANIINLSMLESLEYYEFKLMEAEKHHEGLKMGIIPKDHSMSMAYASKSVRDLKKTLETAKLLWS